MQKARALLYEVLLLGGGRHVRKPLYSSNQRGNPKPVVDFPPGDFAPSSFSWTSSYPTLEPFRKPGPGGPRRVVSTRVPSTYSLQGL